LNWTDQKNKKVLGRKVGTRTETKKNSNGKKKKKVVALILNPTERH